MPALMAMALLSAACAPVMQPTPVQQAIVITVEVTATSAEARPTATPRLVVVTATVEPSKTPTPTKTSTPTKTPFYSFQDGPTRTPYPGQVSWRGDLHVHSGCTKADYETWWKGSRSL
jgi:hypothetical protein